MTDFIDAGLRRLRREPLEGDLAGLEARVRSRIDARAQTDLFKGRLIPVQLAVTAAGLLLGFMVADLMTADSTIHHSETAVLSDDSGLAPSVRLEGGA